MTYGWVSCLMKVRLHVAQYVRDSGDSFEWDVKAMSLLHTFASGIFGRQFYGLNHRLDSGYDLQQNVEAGQWRCSEEQVLTPVTILDVVS